MWDDEIVEILEKEFKGKPVPLEDDDDGFAYFEAYSCEHPDGRWTYWLSIYVTIDGGVITDFEASHNVTGDDGLGDYDPEDIFDHEELYEAPVAAIQELVDGI